MTKQTVFLFARALIIGILVNVGLQLVSDSPLSAQQAGIVHQPKITISHSSEQITVPFLDPLNN